MPPSFRTVRTLAFICAFMLLFTSCSTKSKAPENILRTHTGNFDATASISYRDIKAMAGITRENPQSCSVTFSSPQSLSGMAFVFREDGVDLSYKGLSFSFDPSSLPGGAVAQLSVAAINRAMRDEGISVDYTGGALTLSGLMEGGEFSLRVDRESGSLMKLSVPAEELEIEFINFTFLD